MVQVTAIYNGKREQGLRMLVLFDLDGTLISSYMDNPDRNYDHWTILPHRKEILHALLAQGHTIGIVTNQAGVAFGHITEKKAMQRIHAVFDALELTPYPAVQVSYGHPKARIPRYRKREAVARRKPSGRMLREHIAMNPEAASEGVIYVGDRPEDEAAAKDASVDFVWTDAFFRLVSVENK